MIAGEAGGGRETPGVAIETRGTPRSKPRWWAAYVGFLLNGMGVVVLGPLLPRLLGSWGLSDAAGGALLAAQFVGQSVGSTFVLREKRHALSLGAGCAWAGMSALALLLRAHTVERVEVLAWIALTVYGYGLGQVITTLNLGVGAGTSERAARISTGNGFWSVGAILAPVLAGVAASGGQLWCWLLGFGLCFPAVWVVLSRLWIVSVRDARPGRERVSAAGREVALFVGLVFFYGGAEACLSGWITTFARRTGGTVSYSPLSTSAFWVGIAMGRVLAGRLLSGRRERDVLMVLVGGAVFASGGLVFAQSLWAIAAWAGVCGLLLGPVFALLVAGTLEAGASARQAGLVMAMSGVGGALMLWVLGVVSARVGSLREALVLPGICLAGVLVLTGSFSRRAHPGKQPA